MVSDVAQRPPSTEEGSGGLRESKKLRLREELIAAALERFATDGFDATTIDDIVRDVGVSRRTFFRYFETKEDVVTAWFARSRTGLREALEARPEGEAPFESLRWAFHYVAGVYEADRAEALLVERLVATTASLRGRKLERMAEHAKDLSEVFAKRLGLDAERDLAPRLIGRIAMAAGTAAFETWVAGGGKGSLARLMEEALRFAQTGELPSRAAPRRGVRSPR